MRIERLTVRNLRILSAAELEPEGGINLFTGPNGAGKTTVLEALHLLGRGRSFRHADAGPLVREGAQAALVSAAVRSDSGEGHRIGIRREKRTFAARLDGRDLHRRSDLVRHLPLQLLAPGSHDLVERGPDLRRRFLDEGLFHVEQGYHGVAAEYGRALRQRNAALRGGNALLAASFEPLLARTGEALGAMRATQVQRLSERVAEVLDELEAGFRPTFRYHPGWSGSSLEAVLSRNREREVGLGHTLGGPHRAELRMEVEGRPAARVLSRGQQKLLVYAMGLAQLELVSDALGEYPVLLVDDLPAELDGRRSRAVYGWIGRRPVQAFVTAIEGPSGEVAVDRVFHVEQGVVTPAGQA